MQLAAQRDGDLHQMDVNCVSYRPQSVHGATVRIWSQVWRRWKACPQAKQVTVQLEIVGKKVGKKCCVTTSWKNGSTQNSFLCLRQRNWKVWRSRSYSWLLLQIIVSLSMMWKRCWVQMNMKMKNLGRLEHSHWLYKTKVKQGWTKKVHKDTAKVKQDLFVTVIVLVRVLGCFPKKHKVKLMNKPILSPIMSILQNLVNEIFYFFHSPSSDW